MIYTTKNTSADFDWTEYFTRLHNGEIPSLDTHIYFQNIRHLLSENAHLLGLVLGDVLRKLLRGVQIKTEPRMLELGAGTGFLTRLLLTMYQGSGVLVDNCQTSFNAYNKIADKHADHITYILQDLFTLELEETFDVVCSFGLIEHFKEKNEILSVHKQFCKEDGHMILVVPMDSFLTRAYYEVHPEINLGYRELLTKKTALEQLRASGLEPIRAEVSQGYVYDFLAILCK
ncbi:MULTISPECIES: cyclopropane-fatty-acyl-phospholipid synthase family protein [Brevibacillus]|uniref:Class I SAM-dependent methyltransferase n=1 Tax=Brevibacillus brevis TaxID=1393 RepID=A0A2Z4MJ42_BREBE|nr:MULTISPECIES: class I SAM-dependent methyltransferase [Brevibacillus]AWX56433.1 class I SAM-dependent methyltransferase [Brevibacillus brevis]NRR19864.1 class I SAM-dependent methyltransferase [Brevibacillus sp. MS2.2]